MPRQHLLARFARLDRYAWIDLGPGDTPAQRLDGLSAALGRDVWIKRDDLTGEPYGGNKVRKLEPILAAAKRAGHRAVITVGGVGSNHAIATCVYANILGLKAHAVLFPQPITDEVRKNLAAATRLGLTIHPCAARPFLPLALWRAKHLLGDPYVIAPGGSSALGSLGYVEAALELAEQIRRGLLPRPDDIFVPLGSAGTVAGLQLGLDVAGLPCRLHAVRVVERCLMNGGILGLLAESLRRLLRPLGLDKRFEPSCELHIVHDQFGGRYGRTTAAAELAVAKAAQYDGVALETTYTGKAFAAMLAHHQRAERSRRFLFWNTFNSRDLETLPAAPEPSSLPPSIARLLDVWP